jgi:hypothetical protein
MSELTPQQIAVLDRLVANGFASAAFPLYGNAIGIRKGNCAALLEPVPSGGFRLFGEPCVLLDGNLTVRVTRESQSWFVWKKQRLAATPERIAELDRFASELKLQLEPHA